MGATMALPVPAKARDPRAVPIDVWRADLAAARPLREDLELVLSRDELERASRYRFAPDRERFALARGILRVILGEYLGSNPAAIRFTYGSFGKPGVRTAPGSPPLFFNVSHGGGQVAYAVSRAAEVGIDLERVRSGVFEEGWSAAWLSPREQWRIAQVGDPWQRERTMFDLWTRKEAFLKGLGWGHRLRLHEVEAPAGAGAPLALVGQRPIAPQVAGWSVVQLDFDPGLSAALACYGCGARVVLRRFACSSPSSSWKSWPP
jgi:4'-phosphopantetheinyl transferase